MKYFSRLFFIVLLLSGCDKRYEDGPCLSFIKAENRICGVWRVDQADQAGLALLPTALDTLRSFTFDLNINSSKAMFLTLHDKNDSTVAECLVRPNERFTTLSFQLLSVQGYESALAPLFRNYPVLRDEQAWSINKLRRDEMWLSAFIADGEHQLKFQLVYDHQNP